MGRGAPTHIDDPRALGSRLRALRRERGLSLRALAFDGCSAAYICRIEGGARVPSPPILRRLAERLEVAPEELAGIRADGRVAASRVLTAEIALRLEERDAEPLIHSLLEDARLRGDGEGESRALEALARLAMRGGDVMQALAMAEQARARHPGACARDRPSLHEVLGAAYAGTGDLARAEALLAAALDEVSEEPCDPGLVTRFACRLAEVHAGQGRFAEAEHVLSRALRVEREVTDPAERAKLEWSLARTYAEQGRLALAERYARNVIAHLELSEGRVALGRAHWALARTLTSQGRHSEAVTHLARARELLAETGDELPSLALEESRLALASGDTAMAERRARDVLEIATAAEELQAGAHLQLARAALTRDRAAQARDHGTRAVALLDGIESPALLADACDVLSRAEEQTGDLLAALAAARRAAAVRAGVAAARPAVGVTSAE